MRTLVLDQGYQPHHVIDWKRAIGMLFDGKVEIVEEYDETASSPSVTIRIPSVVRLLCRLRFRRAHVKFSRINVAARDDFCCQYCGQKLPLRELTYDHVVPRSRGGRATWQNIVMACRPCNGRKADRTPGEAGMKLQKQPARPRGLPHTVFRIDPTSSVPEAWANWLYWHGTLEET